MSPRALAALLAAWFGTVAGGAGVAWIALRDRVERPFADDPTGAYGFLDAAAPYVVWPSAAAAALWLMVFLLSEARSR